MSYVTEKNQTDGWIVINLFVFIITGILVYQKTFSTSMFTMGLKIIFSYAENNGAHPLDSKENDKKKFTIAEKKLVGCF